MCALCSVLFASCTSGQSAQNAAAGAEDSLNIKSLRVVVYVQRDFFDPSGALYVGGSEVLPEKIAAIAPAYDAIIFTLDWHPGNHCSFAPEGGMWPPHCVAFTQGAGLPDAFKPILAQNPDRVQFFLKGTETDKEQYGAFENLEEGVALNWLQNCERIDVCGIAGDYCVKETTANILKIVPSEKVTMLMECIRSIDDGTALEEFIKANNLGRK